MAQPQSTATGAPPAQPRRGIVKQVLSGNAVVIRGQPQGGPPPERTLALTNITAPKLARRANPSGEGNAVSKDEPYAWEAREFLRKLLGGKEVMFDVQHTPSSGWEYGTIWVNVGGEPKNVTDMLVSEGLVEVRQAGIKQTEELRRVTQLEVAAKAAGKGKWNKEPDQKPVVRDVSWNLSNEELRQFVERQQGKELDGIVEHVRDGATLRVLLVPQFQVLTVAMSGIKCPMFKREGDKEAEPYAEMAKFFTESRLLQRDIKLLLEGVSNQLVLATVIHPAGSIAELLLKEGFARCVDWSMAVVSSGRDKLRATERQAKEQHLRIWKDYQPSKGVAIPIKSKEFSGKVVEVVNADALVVKTGDGVQKIHFSSLRPPRTPPKEDGVEGGAAPKSRPLYDVPYMFEAREFLRKKLIGKKVNVTVDYLKPAQDNFPERTCCTVTREGVNIAEALISKGLAYCLRHKQDDDQRSSQYDDLLGAEARAIRNGKGVHSKKEHTTHRVADISGEPSKAKQFLPFLQRAGRTIALVEFVASGSRMRLYLPKDTCLITFLLAGISCPRAPRATDSVSATEPFGQEALLFTKELIMQREVEVEVESVDKGGNFIGWLYIEGKNLSLALVEEGLSKVIPQAERSSHGRALFAAEEQAKAAGRKLWEGYVEPTPDEEPPEEAAEEQTVERKINHQKVVITEVSSCTHFWAQAVDQGPHLETLMEQMRSDLTTNPPLAGAFHPKKGSHCVAKFTDDLWYRATVEKVTSKGDIHVLYVDFGNRHVVPSTKVAAIPSGYSGLPPQAKEYYLACAIAPDDEDWLRESFTAFCNEVVDKPLLLNTEYRMQGQEYVTLQHVSDNTDVAQKLISEGLLRVERKKDRRLTKLLADYVKAEQAARKARLNMWCYGDFTPDDAREFGYQK